MCIVCRGIRAKTRPADRSANLDAAQVEVMLEQIGKPQANPAGVMVAFGRAAHLNWGNGNFGLSFGNDDTRGVISPGEHAPLMP